MWPFSASALRKKETKEKTMKTILKSFALAALLAIAPAWASAQGTANFNGIGIAPFQYLPVSAIDTTAATEPLFYIKYFGPGGTATTTVASTGTTLTFVVNGAAYTGFECPVSGALGGIIDTSNAACDTAGEVIDIINATAPTFATGYFRAVIGAGTRASTANATMVTDAADTEVTTPTGEVIFWLQATEDDNYIGLWDYTKGFLNWTNGQRLPKNPNADTDTILLYASEKLTNAGTITDFEVHCTVENYLDGQTTSSEVDRIIYLEPAGATTVIGKIDEFLNAGGLTCRGGKMWLRVLASGADTSAQQLIVTGYKRATPK
jgi:hypothetical protein